AERDTVSIVFFPFEYTPATFRLPAPVGGHTATTLRNGSTLIAGGASRLSQVGSAGLAFLLESGRFQDTELTMRQPRVGHTGTLLPDGRVLFLGGSQRYADVNSEFTSLDDFVERVEIYDPLAETIEEIPVVGAPVRRANHTTFVTEVDGSTSVSVLLYGGVGDVSYNPPRLGLRDDLRTMVLENDTLFAVGPTFRFRFERIGGHSQTMLPPPNGQPELDARLLVAGSDYVRADVVNPVFFELDVSVENGLTQRAVEGFVEPRIGHAAARIVPFEFVGIFGGRGFVPTDVRGGAEAFVPKLGQFLAFPNSDEDDGERWGHTATNWINGRILLLGGFDSSGLATDRAVFFGRLGR
ncbi:MAG: hypothetical protein AAF752_14950, partial [Bacteroidota bacterium]